MKKIFILTLVCLAYMGYGQIETPAASPFATWSQDVGLSTISVEYSRPSMKERTIFAENGLVPFGKKWRTGANSATKITFSDNVMIGENKLDAGSYAILTTPNVESWDIHLFPYSSSSFGTYLEMEPALTWTSEVFPWENGSETFNIFVHDLKTSSCSVLFMWENTIAALPIEVEVDSKVMAMIDQVMAGPSKGDYYQAASYYHSSGKDLNQALKYISKATDGDDPKFWQVRRKALILADLGKVKEAVKAAELSMMLAEKAGNDDYVRMNKKSIAEWKSM